MQKIDWIYWINMFSTYGWFLLLPLVERLLPTRAIPMVHKGVVSDILHTYEPFIRPAVVVFGVSALQFAFPGMLGDMFKIPSAWPLWIQIIILIVISEFTFYWGHRLSHASPVFWEFHRVHHSSTSFQSLMTSRFHPLDSLVFTAPYIFIINLTGIDMTVIYWFGVFQAFMDRYGHSNINGPHWTGYFLTTPHFHAWHHSNDPRAMNKNFCRDFVFFDYLFGTAFYPKNERAAEFGEQSYPVHFHLQLIKPFTVLWQRYITAKSDVKSVKAVPD